jgi:hypothetical protein
MAQPPRPHADACDDDDVVSLRSGPTSPGGTAGAGSVTGHWGRKNQL